MIESKKHLFQLIAPIFLFRLLNAFLCRTFFQPDEYYQSLEIAHTIVYGYGHQTWEWSPSSDRSTGGIRSPLHPFLFVPVYGFLSLTGLDRTQLLIYLPKLVQAAIATLTDLATYSLATVILTPSYGPAALVGLLPHLLLQRLRWHPNPIQLTRGCPHRHRSGLLAMEPSGVPRLLVSTRHLDQLDRPLDHHQTFLDPLLVRTHHQAPHQLIR